ncbi:gag-pol polyprotein [Tanacetum coccineum]
MATKFKIKKFNGNNFSLWKLKMKAILRNDKCLATIGERPTDFTYDSKWDEMDGNAIANLYLALAYGVLSSIEEKKSAKEIWDHLARLYEARSLHNKKFLKRKLYALRMTESTSVTEHVNNLNTLFSKLTSLSFFDDVVAAILEEENRRNNREDRQTSSRQVEALVVMRGRSMEPGSSGSHNHDKSKTGKKKNFKCFKCGKPGHFRKDCQGLNTSYPQGNVASTSEDGNALCCESTVANESRKRFTDVWLFDMGATFHMTARREWFHQYKPISGGGSVYSCNDHELKIIGIGSIMVKMHDGTVEIQNKIMKIIKGALALMRGEKVAANLYQLKGEIIEEAEASVASHNPSHRVGNMASEAWTHQHHLKLKTSNSKSVYVLELVHSDVWKAPILSLRGAKYFVSFIDDYSRRCWVYPIKKKSDMFEVFKVYKAWVELDSGKNIKYLRTDNGGKYTSDEFDTFCRQEGIKRQFTTAYTPQRNGVAERMHKTLLEKERAMLETTSLGKSFWAEAVNTACYVINHSPSTAVELKTPMEMWTKNPVNYSDLHIFGSPVYVMYNTQETTKLDPKSRKCLFLGVDVKTTFLHGNLEEEIYMLQPEGLKKIASNKLKANWLEIEMKTWTANKILEMQIHRDRPISTPFPTNVKLSSKMSPSSKKERMKMSRVPYASAVGSLMFAMIYTRPDITHVVGVVSRYMTEPGRGHWEAVKRILRYIKGTLDVALCFGDSDLIVKRYVDSDYAGDLDGSKSTTGYVFTIWRNSTLGFKKKTCSRCGRCQLKAEFVALLKPVKKQSGEDVVGELGARKREKLLYFVTIPSAIVILQDSKFYSKTKHIRAQYHFVREKVKEGTVDMQKIHTDDNVADYIMKAINCDKFILVPSYRWPCDKSIIEMCEPNTKYNWERIRIMPPKMTTRSAGRATIAPRGGRTSRGGGRTGGRSGDQGNGRIDGQGGQVGGQGSEVNDGVDEVPDFSTILTQKCKTFDWGEEQEREFQTFKDKLCNAPVLALPDGLEDFVVYYDASGLGLGCVLMQRGDEGDGVSNWTSSGVIGFGNEALVDAIDVDNGYE